MSSSGSNLGVRLKDLIRVCSLQCFESLHAVHGVISVYVEYVAQSYVSVKGVTSRVHGLAIATTGVQQ